MTDLKTAKPLLDLWKISHKIKQDKELTEYLLQNQEKSILELLQGKPQYKAIADEITNYINEYFWMTSTDEDLYLPRWKEKPDLPLTLLRDLLEPGAQAPVNTEEAQEQIRLTEEAKAQKILSKGLNKLLFWKRKSFWKQLRIVQKYSWWREETRLMLSRTYYFVHKALIELASRYQEQGWIQEPIELFYLTYEEVREFMQYRNVEKVQQLIANYKTLKAMYLNFEPPSTIGGVFSLELESGDGVTEFTGVGSSPGEVTGKARVILTLDEAHLIEPGEILVVPYTNPGWTPVFSIIKGIIMEEGGLLSHGAVVARECGIPSVLQIDKATKKIKTGDLIYMNGNTGIVKILEPSSL